MLSTMCLYTCLRLLLSWIFPFNCVTSVPYKVISLLSATLKEWIEHFDPPQELHTLTFSKVVCLLSWSLAFLNDLSTPSVLAFLEYLVSNSISPRVSKIMFHL